MTRLERLADRAVALPAAAFVLLTPPILHVFGRDATVLGIPVLFLYAFTVWAVLIALGRALSRSLRRAAEAAGDGPADGAER